VKRFLIATLAAASVVAGTALPWISSPTVQRAQCVIVGNNGRPTAQVCP
jgi:hypothetical protein